MPTENHLSIQAIIKEGWQEWKTVSLIFLVIVFPAAALLMTTLPKSAVLWGSFMVAIIVPPLILSWKERRKKRHNEVKLSESGMSFIPGQSIRGYIRSSAYMRANREDSQSLEKLRQLLAVYRHSNVFVVQFQRINNITASVSAMPPIGFGELAWRLSGNVGSSKSMYPPAVIPGGALSDSENMTASAQLPAQKWLEATYPLHTGRMKVDTTLIAD